MSNHCLLTFKLPSHLYITQIDEEIKAISNLWITKSTSIKDIYELLIQDRSLSDSFVFLDAISDKFGLKFTVKDEQIDGFDKIKAVAVMKFANMHVGAFEAGVTGTNMLNVADLHQTARNHVRDNYGHETKPLPEEWDDQLLYDNCKAEPIEKQIIKWFANGDTGISSKAMASVASGVDFSEIRHKCTPSDGDDLHRCLKLLKAVPGVRQSFPRIAKLSPSWGNLIENWDTIEQLFYRESGVDFSELGTDKQLNPTPELYRLITETSS